MTPRLGIEFSAASTLLLAAIPKCPICWMTLMSTIGFTWPITSGWLRGFVVALLFGPLALLFVRAFQCRNYRPFVLGLVAAISMYLFKFQWALDMAMYLSGAMLFGATLWSAKLRRHETNELTCRC